jgi:hypothetical protein
LTKEELEENVAKNATKLKNPKVHRKEKLKRQATIKEDDENRDISSRAIRMRNVTKLKIDAAAAESDQAFTTEIMSPTNYLSNGESISKICVCGRNEVEQGKEYCFE